MAGPAPFHDLLFLNQAPRNIEDSATRRKLQGFSRPKRPWQLVTTSKRSGDPELPQGLEEWVRILEWDCQPMWRAP
jgi:hypothetical protein